MKRGKCELCHAVADLRDSHYLPKSGYKKMRASDLKNPNPVLLAGGKAQQSSLQVRDYKFCDACEERFNKGGEAWILSKIPQNYGDPFWLHTLLNSKPSLMNGNDLLFSQASIPEVDMAKLVYFALSIFWRGTLPAPTSWDIETARRRSIKNAIARALLSSSFFGITRYFRPIDS